MEIKDIFYINVCLKGHLDMEFSACSGELMMPEEVLTSFTVSYAYR